MKVRDMFGWKSVARGLTACVLASALAGSVAAPVAASAEEALEVRATAVVAATASLAATESVNTTGSIGAIAASLTTVSVPATAPVKPAVKKLTVKQQVAKVGRDKGLKSAEVKALMWICKRESNFHPSSKSQSGCYGLFQLSAKMVKGKPWKNPVWNTGRAIRYMKGRYGGVLQAKAFWIKHHWY